MTCAHLGQCGGAGLELLVLLLRMKQNIAPGIPNPTEALGAIRMSIRLTEQKRSLALAGRWWETHYCDMARGLILGNRRS